MLVLTSPIWLINLIRTGKIRTDWHGRFGRTSTPSSTQPRILLHAVSVGEVNALRNLVSILSALPNPPSIIISSTTNTGFARARELFSPAHQVVRYPLDFSFAVSRFLDTLKPSAVVLVELELWPAFSAACERRHIPLAIINGRLSARSLRRYSRLRAFFRPSFQRLAFVAAQNQEYAARFASLGVPQDRIHVTGNIKWDSAGSAQLNPSQPESLAASLHINRNLPLIVAGSTAPGEHELFRNALPAKAQLLCAPRKPEWFDQAADALSPCIRRTNPAPIPDARHFLLDTIGELRAAYALADLVIIGRSFGNLYGSDPLEAASLAKPIIIGPAVDDFRDIVDALLSADAIIQTDAASLPATVAQLLADTSLRTDLGNRARSVVTANLGATKRCLDLILPLFSSVNDD
ncbi:MAG TPA: glycosyltransferase N-terminal domain-containing protein [Phycisphaerales bacterium]|nr:glycosyltransferase N-terminal domain-containing protein [Phycisphaerales bacterium]